jgi:hypothetical protein
MFGCSTAQTCRSVRRELSNHGDRCNTHAEALTETAEAEGSFRLEAFIWDGEYRLDAYQDATRNRKSPGFVIEHPCGLSLVHRSESGELGVTEHSENEDIRQNASLTSSRRISATRIRVGSITRRYAGSPNGVRAGAYVT